MNALARLGMVSEFPSENQTTIDCDRRRGDGSRRTIRRAGWPEIRWHASAGRSVGRAQPVAIPSISTARCVMRRMRLARRSCTAHFHHFTPNGGVSGVVVLAESHISIHTWPENGLCRDRHLHVRRLRSAQVDPGAAGGVHAADRRSGEQRRGMRRLTLPSVTNLMRRPGHRAGPLCRMLE